MKGNEEQPRPKNGFKKIIPPRRPFTSNIKICFMAIVLHLIILVIRKKIVNHM